MRSRTNADAGFEAGDGTADGGLGDAEGLGGADEATAFDYSCEDADTTQEAIIESHRYITSCNDCNTSNA